MGVARRRSGEVDGTEELVTVEEMIKAIGCRGAESDRFSGKSLTDVVGAAAPCYFALGAHGEEQVIGLAGSSCASVITNERERMLHKLLLLALERLHIHTPEAPCCICRVATG